jgi:hypothetical protein
METSDDVPLGTWFDAAPGLRIQRRCLLRTLALALAGARLPALAEGADTRVTLEEFVAEVLPVARALVTDRSVVGQDRYLLALAAHAVRLVDVPEPEFRESGQGPGAWIGVNGVHDPFVILHWKLAPHGVVHPHAHSYGNVVTLGLEGTAVVENYEMEGVRDLDTREPFVARRTVRQRLTAGSINRVSLERDYVHGFRAGASGARGLDLTTGLLPRRPTPWLRLEAPLPGDAPRFRGRWADAPAAEDRGDPGIGSPGRPRRETPVGRQGLP